MIIHVLVLSWCYQYHYCDLYKHSCATVIGPIIGMTQSSCQSINHNWCINNSEGLYTTYSYNYAYLEIDTRN